MQISVIVPVYNVELYIRQCLDSLAAQTFSDIEFILVDDGSTDGCPGICDEYAAKYERFHVIHKENGGLSDARNVGIEQASGAYLGFVDPDDWVAPDFYAYLYNGIKAYDADISVCEYYNVWPKKADATNRPAVRLFEGEGALKALLLLKIGNYAWNKLYKRELFADDIRYPKGKKYEDVQTTYRLFQRVSTVVALPDPKYFYRRRADGITGTKSLGNEAMRVYSRMMRYDILEDTVAQWPDVNAFLLREIYDYAMEFRKAVLVADETSLSHDADLFEAVCSFLTSHAEDICTMKGWGGLGRKAYGMLCRPSQASWKQSVAIEKLIERKTKIAALAPAKKARSNADKLYVDCATLPINENLAFVESRAGEDLAGNMLCIVQALLARGIKTCVCAKDGHASKVNGILQSVGADDARIISKESAEYDEIFSQAKYLFSDMVYPERMVKKEGQVFVNTWHGTPLKMLEYDVVRQRHILGGATRDFMRCDYFVVPSDYLAEKLLDSSSVQHLCPGRVLYSGYPRNSVFFDTKRRQTTRNALGVEDIEVFVYMPTWRGTQNAHVDVRGEYAAQSILDFFEGALKDNQVMYVKLHNYAVADVSYEGYTHVRPFPDDIDSYSVLNVADCLITDYSSVFFDYACTGGKIILFTYDVESYLRDRGLYLDLEELPFPKVMNYEQLAAELDVVKRYDDADFRRAYCTYECADSSQRLLNAVIDGKSDGIRVESVPDDGKKNILLYDARYPVREYISEGLESYLAGLDVSQTHYYYGYRQWCLKKTPAVLANLPEGVKPYAFTNGDYRTTKEMNAMKKGTVLPASYINHEVNRLFFGNPFDEIYVIDTHEHDPYVRLLAALPNYRGSIDTGV